MFARFCLISISCIFFCFITVLSATAQVVEEDWWRGYDKSENGWIQVNIATKYQLECPPGDMDGVPGSIIGDFNYLIAYLLECGSPPPCQPVEANGNCELDIGDLLYLAQYLIYGSPYMPVPFCSNPDTYSDPGYPDTVRIGTVSASCNKTVDVPIYIDNDETIFPVIPLKIDTNYVVCNSVITAGTRGTGIIQASSKYCEDSTGVLLYGSSTLPAGSGIVAYLRCRIKDGAPSGFAEIDSSFLDPNKLRFFKENTFSIKPVFMSGGITIGLCGDANGDEDITVSDVVYLISYLFKGGSPPTLIENGDVNCDSQISVSDVIFLISYLFKNGPEPGCQPSGFLINYTGCKTFQKRITLDSIPPDQDCIEYEYDGESILKLKHINAGFNCCPDNIIVDITIENNIITIEEKESLINGGCKCLCLFDLELEITDLEPGEYIIRVIEPYVDPGDELLEFNIDLFYSPSLDTYCVSRNHYPWETWK